MLAGARVRRRREGRGSRAAAQRVLERVCRFSLVAGWSHGLDAHDQRGIFGWHGAGGDEVSEFVDVEGRGLGRLLLFWRKRWRCWKAAR